MPVTFADHDELSEMELSNINPQQGPTMVNMSGYVHQVGNDDSEEEGEEEIEYKPEIFYSKKSLMSKKEIQYGTLPEEEFIDTQNRILLETVEQAGMLSFGTVCVEVWLLTKDRTKLFLLEGGYWVDPVFANSHPSEALDMLMDRDHPHYESASLIGPGESIPGVLWQEINAPVNTHAPVKNPITNFGGGGGLGVGTFRRNPMSTIRQARPGTNRQQQSVFAKLAGTFRRQPDANVNTMSGLSQPLTLKFEKAPRILWRDIPSIADDPFQPYSQRVLRQIEAGLGLAGGVKFNVRGHKGIVVFYARRNANRSMLQSQTNLMYLRKASDLIGAISATRDVSIDAYQARMMRVEDTKRKIKSRLVKNLKKDPKEETIHHSSLASHASHLIHDIESSTYHFLIWMKEILMECELTGKMWLKKFAGGGMKPPPPGTWSNTRWTFFGCLLQLVLIELFNIWLVKTTEDSAIKRSVLLPPFAALSVLLYGLTPAPPSQPKAALLGTLSSSLIGLVLNKIPMTSYRWLVHVLSSSLASAFQVKMGIIHPPASAYAIIFVDQKDGVDLIIVMFLYILCILLAAAVNNLSSHRQYPTYWFGFQFKQKND